LIQEREDLAVYAIDLCPDRLQVVLVPTICSAIVA
jgi:hypothetical protein